MATNTAISVLFPTGRIVQGNLYKAQDKDADGKPMTVKSGPNQGKPTVQYYFGVAIKKTQAHWANETFTDSLGTVHNWGRALWDLGHASWPAGQAKAPTFAWKITDGDSVIPNRKGKKPAEREGFPGHWVVHFSSQFAPKIYNSNGSQILAEADYVKPGYFVMVAATVDTNRSDMNPGMYINHSMIAFQGFGPEIIFGPDAAAAFAGAAPAPAGMSAAPVGGLPASAVPGAPVGAPPPPAPPVGVPAAAPTVAAVPAPSPQPMAVAPAPAMIVPPAAPPAPVVPTGPVVKLAGVSWASMVQAGWNETTARAAGHIA